MVFAMEKGFTKGRKGVFWGFGGVGWFCAFVVCGFVAAKGRFSKMVEGLTMEVSCRGVPPSNTWLILSIPKTHQTSPFSTR